MLLARLFEGRLTGHRFVLASTQELHEKISDMANRVRELEDGLKLSHAKTSSEPHPLLSEELLKIKMPLQREPQALRNGGLSIKEEENPPDALDAFGSLSISLSGRTKYFGHIANSWVSLSVDLMHLVDFKVIPVLVVSPGTHLSCIPRGTE